MMDMYEPPYRNYCVRCHALDVEPAREGCANPDWHTPPPATKNAPAIEEPD